MSKEPTKAYLIKYAIVNEMEAVVYATSTADALRRFEDGEGNPETTGEDWRLGKPTATRFPPEDKE